MTQPLPRRIFFCAITGCALFRKAAAFQFQRRRVEGEVTDREGIPLEGAVVQIENALSLKIRSYITNQQGSYHFAGLNSYANYRLSAAYDGVRSSVKTVSQFDERPVVVINLEVSLGQRSVGWTMRGGQQDQLKEEDA